MNYRNVRRMLLQARNEQDEIPSVDRAPEIPGFELLRKLGEGATAVVYEARDLQLNRRVAIKILKGLSGRGKTVLSRIRREGRILSQIAHPNIVKAHAAGESGDHFYLVLELVRGESLQGILSRRDLGIRELVAIVEKACRGVAEAHRRGIIHRDLKPANIIVTGDGEPKVGDFGLARTDSQETALTQPGTPIGTPDYMSPEQVRGGPDVGPWSDVYSLGAILYEAVTGSTPYSGETLGDVYAKILSEDPLPPSRRNPQTPPVLESIVQRAMERDPARRYANAGDLGEELRTFLKIGAAPPSKAARVGFILHGLRSRWRRRRWPVLRTACALLVGLAAVWAMAVKERDAARFQQAGAFYDLSLSTQEELALLQASWQTGLADPRRQAALAAVGDAVREVERKYPKARGPRALHALARFFAEDPAGFKELESAVAGAEDDPFPGFLLGRACLNEYLRRLCLPTVTWSGNDPARLEEFRETPGMRKWSERALAAFRSANGSTTWQQLPRNDAVFRYEEGATALGKGEYRKAEAAFSDLRRHAFFRSEADALRGLTLFLSNRFEEAAGAWKAVADAGWHRFHNWAGLACLCKGKDAAEGGEDPLPAYASGLSHLDEAIRHLPDENVGFVDRGIARMLIGDAKAKNGQDAAPEFRLALADLDRATGLEPANAVALDTRGTVKLRLFNAEKRVERSWLDKAIEDFAAALAQDPRNPAARMNLGMTFVVKGRELERHLEDPLSEYRKGVDALTKLLDLTPSNPAVWSLRGTAWLEIARCESARGESPAESLQMSMGDFDRAIELNPREAMALLGRGRVFLTRAKERLQGEGAVRDLYECVAAVNRCLEVHPELPNAHSLRGEARQRLGMMTAELKSGDSSDLLKGALGDCSEALLRNPRDAETLNRRGCLLTELGARGDSADAWERALQDFDEAARLAPQDAAPPFNRALLRVTRAERMQRTGRNAGSDWELAESDFRKAVQLAPQDLARVIGLALFLRTRGRIDEALSLVEEVLGRKPGHPGAQSLKKELEALRQRTGR